jgi:serine/threonine-protein kinase RsbW
VGDGNPLRVRITSSLLLPRDEISVPTVRHVCRSALQDLGVIDSCNDDIQLALTEACTNVLRHAQGTSQEYEVTLDINESTCEISVNDAGAGFEHSELGLRISDEEAESGRGIHLMRTLVDEVQFISVPHNGIIVHLAKSLICEEGSVLSQLADRLESPVSVSSKDAGARKS